MSEARSQKSEILPWLCRILILLSVLCPLSSAYAAHPDSIQATYDVYKGSIKVAEIEEVYTRNKGHYTLSSTTRPFGLLAVFKPGTIVLNSSGLVGTRGLQPLRFSDQRENDEGRNRSAEFDWEAKQLTLIQQAQRTVFALPDGTQDRLSAMYQFMFLPLQSATTLDFPMTNRGKPDNHHYAITHGQPLDTPAGTFNTLYLDDQAKPGERRTEIWLAMQQHNLPCKMTITDGNGDQLTQVLSKLEIK